MKYIHINEMLKKKKSSFLSFQRWLNAIRGQIIETILF